MRAPVAMARSGRARTRKDAVLAAFCAASLVFLAVRDLTVPEVRDVEVWLGFELRGLAVLATAPGLAAIAVVRISGSKARAIGGALTGLEPRARYAALCTFRDAQWG